MKNGREQMLRLHLLKIIMYFRLSEVYLNAAEAGVKIGGASAVKGLNYLNAIVQRANPVKEVTAAEYTLDRVLEERSKELIGEGHRFFDMLRNGKDHCS